VSDNVIKEFLVGLGWKVDASGEKRFHDSIRSATLQAKLLGDTIEASLKKLLSVTSQISEAFDKMFYASSRINASVANIKAFQTAVSMLGGTMQSAGQSLENFGRFLRVNPGAYNFIESLGVSVRKTNGELRDSTEILEDLVKVSKDKPYGVQMKIAELLGISENDWRAMMNGDFARAKGKSKDIYARLGLDLDKAAKDGQVFANQMRELQTTLGAIGDAIVANLIGKDGKGPITQLTDWLQANGKNIVDVLTSLAEVLVRVVQAMVDWLTKLKPEDMQKVVAWFTDMAKDVKDAKSQLEFFAIFIAGAWVTSILAAFAKVRFGWIGLLALLMTAGKVDENGNLNPTFNPNPPGGDPDLNGAGRMGDWLRKKWENRPGWLGGTKGARLGDASDRGRAGAGRPLPAEAAELSAALKKTAANLGINAEDLATMISFETGGTFDKWKRGPVTKWGQHRGYIQWGEPQRQKYGVTADSTPTQQMEAVEKYLRDRGVKPGMSGEQVYAAINAGSPYKTGASDAGAGGTWGTVADKWRYQMAGHRRQAQKLLRGSETDATRDAVKDVGSRLRGGASDPAEVQKKMSAPPAVRPQSWLSPSEINQTINNTIYGASDASASASEINLAHARANRQLANMIRSTNGAAA
jgi:hypothetical protein